MLSHANFLVAFSLKSILFMIFKSHAPRYNLSNCPYASLVGGVTPINQSRTNGPINAHLTIAQVMPRYNHKKMKNKKHRCKSFVKISAVAQQ